MKVSAAERRKAFFQKYRCALIVPAYGAIYLSWFSYLERTVVQPEHIVHLWLDDLIPFLEVFIVPYMLWFAYVAAVCIFLLAKDRGEFLRNFIFLAIGMTIFLIVSTVYPNGQTLRPASFERQNIFTDMVASLYRTDSPNNVLPSIHVFNSLATWFAVRNSRFLKNHRIVRCGSLALTGLIILSTMFIKQHSVIDVFFAFVMAFGLYPVFYCPASSVYYQRWLPFLAGRRRLVPAEPKHEK